MKAIVAFIVAVLIVDRVCAQEWVEYQGACGSLRVTGHDLVTVADGTYLIGGLGEGGYNSRALRWGGAGFVDSGGGFGGVRFATAETEDGVWVCGGWNGDFIGMMPVVFTGSSWYSPVTGSGPTLRHGSRAAYMPGRGVIMFGGCEQTWWGCQPTGETWAWVSSDGLAGQSPDLADRIEFVWWDQPAQDRAEIHSWVRAADGPSARFGHVMRYVPEFGGIIVFGGETGFVGSERNDVWLYDGEVWTELHVPGGPTPRADAAAAPWGGGLLIQGGNGPECGFSPETWLLRPEGWSRMADGPQKAGHAMAILPDGRPIIASGLGTVAPESYGSAWILTD